MTATRSAWTVPDRSRKWTGLSSCRETATRGSLIWTSTARMPRHTRCGPDRGTVVLTQAESRSSTDSPQAAACGGGNQEIFRLLNPDRIATADGPPLHDGSIHTDVDLVMLGGRAQDSRVSRKIPLRESRHHATPARTGDVQAHRGPDRECAADPGILRKALLTGDELHHDVGTKPPGLEAALRIQLAQAIERGRGQEMDHRHVEERPLG